MKRWNERGDWNADAAATAAIFRTGRFINSRSFLEITLQSISRNCPEPTGNRVSEFSEPGPSESNQYAAEIKSKSNRNEKKK